MDFSSTTCGGVSQRTLVWLAAAGDQAHSSGQFLTTKEWLTG